VFQDRRAGRAAEVNESMSARAVWVTVVVLGCGSSLFAGPTATFDDPGLRWDATPGDTESYLSSVFGQSVTLQGLRRVAPLGPLSSSYGDNWLLAREVGLTLGFASGVDGGVSFDYMLANNGLFNALAFDASGNVVGSFSAHGIGGTTGWGYMDLSGTAHTLRFFDSGWWDVGIDNLQIGLASGVAHPVPEPGTFALLGLGLGGLGAVRAFRRRRGAARAA